MTKTQIYDIYHRLLALTKADKTVNVQIAELLGWTNIVYHTTGHVYRGIKPGGKRISIVPNYTGSVDAAILTIPPKWVESYYRRFDDTVVVECHPRSDLKREDCPRIESSHLPAALCATGVRAHIRMMFNE